MTSQGRHSVSRLSRSNEHGEWTDLVVEGSPIIVPEVEPQICEFGHSGSKVEACERDALEGEHYCAVHYDALYG